MPKKPILSLEEKALFEKAMEKVKPLKIKKAKVRFTKEPPTLRSKTNTTKSHVNPSPNNELFSKIVLTDPQEFDIHAETVLSFHRSGINDKRLKKLRRGEVIIESTIDLHQHTVEQARIALINFLQQCLARENRAVRIIHGKGQREGRYARLKTFIYHWLPQFDFVLAFHSCPPEQGGTGALTVLLKKQ